MTHTMTLIGMYNNLDLKQLSSETFCTSRCLSLKGMSSTS